MDARNLNLGLDTDSNAPYSRGMITNETPNVTTAASPVSPVQLTPEREKRVRAAIADYARFIAKEEARSADLRPAKVQELLNRYKEHVAKLERMLP